MSPETPVSSGKVCVVCETERPHSEFYRRRAGQATLHSECRACSNRRVAELKRAARAQERKAIAEQQVAALKRRSELERERWAEMVATDPKIAAVQDALDRGREASRAREAALRALLEKPSVPSVHPVAADG